jgi:hypothetical protein
VNPGGLTWAVNATTHATNLAASVARRSQNEKAVTRRAVLTRPRCAIRERLLNVASDARPRRRPGLSTGGQCTCASSAASEREASGDPPRSEIVQCASDARRFEGRRSVTRGTSRASRGRSRGDYTSRDYYVMLASGFHCCCSRRLGLGRLSRRRSGRRLGRLASVVVVCVGFLGTLVVVVAPQPPALSQSRMRHSLRWP